MALPTVPTSTTGRLRYFLKPPGERAWQHVNIDPTTNTRPCNFETDAHTVSIENLRGSEHSVSLNTTGFQFYRRPSTHTAFTDDAQVEREYYPECIDLIREVTGATRVVLFDHTIRRNNPQQVGDDPQTRKPISLVHVDQTVASAIARVHRHLPPAEAPELLKRRFQIINLWRPIAHPADDWPLAMCDYRSLDPKADTIPVALIYPDREGETMGVLYNPNHRWKYMSGMTPEEVVLIKCFDSVEDGSVAVFTPHTGFQDPLTPNGAPLRQSIEVRALVFY